MTDNPYARTPDESRWQAGYDSDIGSPGEGSPAPLVLDPDQGTICPAHGEQPGSTVEAVVRGGIPVLRPGSRLLRADRFGIQQCR